MKFSRNKPRHLGLSIAYRLDRFLPLSRERKLDFLLDVEWIANRLAHENAAHLGLHDRFNPFLTDAIKPSERVIDIGCGDGAVLATVTAEKRVGIDYASANIDRGKALHPELELICADALEFDTSGFDVAILSHVLEHIDEPAKLLQSIKARRIYVEVPDLEWSLNNHIRELRGRDLIYTDADHVFEFDRTELQALFSRIGLKIEAVEFRRAVMRYWLEK